MIIIDPNWLQEKTSKEKYIPTRVVNAKYEDYDIDIGRGTKWGNPFIIGVHGTRKECIEKYKRMILSDKKLLVDIPGLTGKVLGCSCKPKACHGDILADLANSYYHENNPPTI